MLGGRRRLLDGQRQQQALDGDEAVARLLGELFGGRKDARQRLRQIKLAVADPRRSAAPHRGFDADLRVARTAAGPLDQRCRHALIVVEQDFQNVLGGELLVVAGQREVCADCRKPRTRSEYFSIFIPVSFPSPARFAAPAWI